MPNRSKLECPVPPRGLTLRLCIPNIPRLISTSTESTNGVQPMLKEDFYQWYSKRMVSTRRGKVAGDGSTLVVVGSFDSPDDLIISGKLKALMSSFHSDNQDNIFAGTAVSLLSKHHQSMSSLSWVPPRTCSTGSQ